MIRYIILLTVFSTSACSLDNKTGTNEKCEINVGDSLDLAHLHSTLRGGKWSYTISSSSDTCFKIEDFSSLDFPKEIMFRYCDDDELSKRDENLFLRRADNLLANIKALIPSLEDIYVTYPVTTYNQRADTLVSKIKVYHESLVEDGAPIRYNYFISQIEKDSMVIEDEKVHSIGEKKFMAVKHLFVRFLPAARSMPN